MISLIDTKYSKSIIFFRFLFAVSTLPVILAGLLDLHLGPELRLVVAVNVGLAQVILLVLFHSEVVVRAGAVRPEVEHSDGAAVRRHQPAAENSILQTVKP